MSETAENCGPYSIDPIIFIINFIDLPPLFRQAHCETCFCKALVPLTFLSDII